MFGNDRGAGAGGGFVFDVDVAVLLSFLFSRLLSLGSVASRCVVSVWR